MNQRLYSAADDLIMGLDQALQTVFGRPHTTERGNPAKDVPEHELTEAEKAEAGRLMRVNHVGEVCAQALYQSQALTARRDETRRRMERAAQEENDHLAWCESRIEELGSRKSLLNPLWYGGSFAVGTLAGIAGDKWNLGFVVETERQVVRHLGEHLQRLPREDARSRAIVEQMKIDESEHATTALRAGAAELPEPVKGLMRLASKLMTRTAHWI